METPEELIAEMTTSELLELLDEMGFEATEMQAASIKSLIQETGSLDAALAVICDCDDDDVRRAA